MQEGCAKAQRRARAVGASKSTRMRPLLITCLSIVVAGLLFVGGLGIGFAAGKWSDAPPVANIRRMDQTIAINGRTFGQGTREPAADGRTIAFGAPLS